MRDHWPIVRTVSAAMSPLAIVTIFHWDSVASGALSIAAFAAWALAGRLGGMDRQKNRGFSLLF